MSSVHHITSTIDHGSYKKIPTIDHGNTKVTTTQADRIIQSVTDLINDSKFNPFFYKKLYKLGPTEFVYRAKRAREAKVIDNGRLFVCLLKD